VCLLAAALGTAGTARGDNTLALTNPQANSVTSAPPFALTAHEREIPNVGTFQQCVLLGQANWFSFIQPPRTVAHTDTDQKKITITARNGAYSLTVKVIEAPQPTNGVKSEVLREEALARYEGADVIDEFTVAANGQSGPAIDLVWRAPEGTYFKTRLASISFRGWRLDLNLTVQHQLFDLHHYTLNRFLLSFRNGRIGTPVEFQQIKFD
jgi:hypothetical protein